jgi:GAF domain-containing protein
VLRGFHPVGRFVLLVPRVAIMTDPFPFRRELSLAALIDQWRSAAESETGARAELAASLLSRVDAVPELHGTIEDPGILDRHRELVDSLMSAVMPAAANPDAFAVALAPFSDTVIHATPGFLRLGLDAALREQLASYAKYAGKALVAYQYILASLYGARFDFVLPFDLVTTDPISGLERYFRLSMDPRFCKASVIGEKPELNEQQMDHLLGYETDMETWLQLLPPERFSLRGFMVFHAVDVTEQQALARLTADLLRPQAMATDNIGRLEAHVRTLLRRPALRLGLICVQRDDMDAITGARAVGRSLLLSEGVLPACCNKSLSYYTQAIEKREPVFIRDLQCCEIPSEYEMHVLEMGMRNLLIAPLELGDRLVGLIEIASPNAGDLHILNAARVRDFLGLFATAMQRMLDDRETRLQAVIKQQYTAIHPSVEWRFRRAADRYIDALDAGRPVPPEAIVFESVYPLYGLSDIRGSSQHRSDAIREDLVEQLDLARAVVVEANRAKPLPVLSELDHRIGVYRSDVANGLRAGDELRVLEFLRMEIDETFAQIGDFGGGTGDALGRYRAALDPDLGFVYRRRRDFEQSVTLISDTVSGYIDREQELAQSMFPHYFEKYKTDGVDYNVYVGPSLQEDGGFQMLYLRNLRLWQLMLMCGIVWELRDVSAQLPIPLETAHLILVQSSPLSIRFRSEEKQFDVDGAYNIRYEIVKKRIDKARIRDTREQLTQPGKLAIVYSHPREAAEYREYIAFLMATGHVTGEIEELELEDLQGASGLEALRVTVASEPARAREVPILERVDRLPRRLTTAPV